MNAPLDLISQFEQEGYVIIEKAISEHQCIELFQFVISSFGSTQPDYIIAPQQRIHCPLLINPLVKRSIADITKPAYEMMNHFLKGEQLLAELSSITVFPYAQGQNLHQDENNTGKYIISIFVNLAPTHADAGSLWIVPGSHKTFDQKHTIDEAIPVEVPIGTAIFMNSKTWHCGGPNQSPDKIRPVFYFSFGDTQLEGPTYSIRKDVDSLGLTLLDFKQNSNLPSKPYNHNSHPQLWPDTSILNSLSEPDSRNIYVLQSGEFKGNLEIEEPWIRDVLAMVALPDKNYTLGEIQESIGVSEERLFDIFSELESMGLITIE